MPIGQYIDTKDHLHFGSSNSESEDSKSPPPARNAFCFLIVQYQITEPRTLTLIASTLKETKINPSSEETEINSQYLPHYS